MLRYVVPATTLVVALIIAVAGGQSLPVVVGVLEPLSGPMQVTGKDFQAGVQLYVKTNPTVLSRRIQLAEQDTQSAVPVAITQLRKLAEADKATAVIGALNSPAAVAVASEAQKRKLPYIEGLARADDVTTPNNTFVFRVSNSAARDARNAFRFLASRSMR